MHSRVLTTGRAGTAAAAVYVGAGGGQSRFSDRNTRSQTSADIECARRALRRRNRFQTRPIDSNNERRKRNGREDEYWVFNRSTKSARTAIGRYKLNFVLCERSRPTTKTPFAVVYLNLLCEERTVVCYTISPGKDKYCVMRQKTRSREAFRDWKTLKSDRSSVGTYT